STDSDAFGAHLAVGNFNGDYRGGRPCLDLAVGHHAANGGKGRVTVLYGGPKGLNPVDTDTFRQGSGNGPAATSAPALFGTALSVGHVNADGFDDLIVGARTDGLGAGSVLTFLGGTDGLLPAPTAWGQGVTSDGVTIPGSPEYLSTKVPPAPYLGFGW